MADAGNIITQLPLDGPGSDDGEQGDEVYAQGDSDDDGSDADGGAGAGANIDVSASWSKEEAMAAVKELVAYTKEINEANTALREIKQQKKTIEQQILAWMKQNTVREVRTTVGVISRRDTQKKDTLKKPFIVKQLRELGHMDEKAALKLTESLWDNRPVVNVESLKYDAPGSKKRGAGKGKRAKASAD